MVRILIFGASGFVGYPIVQALRRHGHTVYAVTRTEEKTIELSKQEIIPILGDARQPETWVPALDLVDIVIDSSSSFGGLSEGILKAIKESQRVTSAKKHDPKIGYLYVSSTWVHGDSPELVTDRVPSKDVLDVAILRAGVVFGGCSSRSLFGLWWAPFVEALKANKFNEPVTIKGRPDASVALVHKHDFAQAILNAVEKFEVVSQIHYPVFDVVSGHESLGDINKAAANVLGFTGEIKYQAPAADDHFGNATSSSLLIDSTRSQSYLDWQPKHTSLIKDPEVYVKAYLYSTDYYTSVTNSN
ncbi:hypothetical protein TWF106_005589 [Orbilia oligospora]|uniref:NAD(P)-binding domain-containing protein n=1 Tax=Orbilia oligospora TaxID=2813651 RepID=A0A6G1M2L8_ORBOL|nr:hypothetical protein TWF106_005589 [Orbilia oligospora]KAF3201332.1 hypothetical protein TWF679_011392 [Orbilia oligospora]KAF3242829.1 hypothetical protein TWF192_008544 [Orbilia oligospora]